MKVRELQPAPLEGAKRWLRDEFGGKRPREVAAMVLAIAFSLFYLYQARFGSALPQLTRGVFVGGAAVIILLWTPISAKRHWALTLLDLGLVGAAVAATYYFIDGYAAMSMRAGLTTTPDIVMGTLMMLVCLESTRRKCGWSLVVIALCALAYCLWGHLLPMEYGGHSGLSYKRTIGYMYMSLSGIFGSVVNTFAVYVIPFILFGAFMEKSGAAQFFIDLPYALTGKYRGGPAKASVIASMLLGMVSGSAVANVMTTGTFTIPLMKKTGYRAHVAGAIEASASVGAQLMPPIMGAGAFVMSEMTGVPYGQIVLIAFVPAFLYYLGLMVMVDVEAAKHNLKGMPAGQLPQARQVLREGWRHILPLGILILFLILGKSPGYAAFWAILGNIVISWFGKKKILLGAFLETCIQGTKTSLTVAATAGTIGIIVGVIQMSGLGTSFSRIVLALSGGQVWLSLILIAVASCFLGLALDITTSYIMLAVLAAPALEKLGIPTLTTHMVIFWFTQNASLSPPVCLTAFAAASVAEAPFMKTGWTAMWYAKVLYIVPVLMVYTHLLMTGAPWQNVLDVVSCIIGVVVFSVASQGYFICRKLHWWEYFLLCVPGFFIFFPNVWISLAAAAALAGYVTGFALAERRKRGHLVWKL